MCKTEVKTKAVKAMTFIAFLGFLVFQSGIVFGGMWSHPEMKNSGVWNMPLTAYDGSSVNAEVPSDMQPEAISGLPAATSSATKLFWLEPGTATLWYVDPGAASPVKTQFATGILTDPAACSIPTGTVDLATYHIADKKIGYVIYAKAGKLWLVDTTSLVKTQISSESGFYYNTICGAKTLVDWQTPANTTFFYVLAGPDGTCATGDEVGRAVRGSMTAADAPINTNPREPMKLLFDGTYVAFNWSTSPFKIEICQPNLTTCSSIGTFTNSAEIGPYDATKFLLMSDGKLKIYNYVSKKMTLLYTPVTNEAVMDPSLDRDGSVYFATYKTVAPYNYSISKVPVGGGTATKLASFTTPALLSEGSWWFELTPSYIAYTYPNSSSTGLNIYSVSKTGGAPVLLTGTAVNGGCVGVYAIFEDSTGKVARVNLSNGSGAISRTKSLLSGATHGGAGDWYYDYDTSTMRIYLSDISHKVRSYAWGEDFSNTSLGVLNGTLPVNLSNLDIDWGLAKANKRGTDGSFGKDILYLKGTAASSLKRLTTTNGDKFLMNHRQQ